MMSPSRWQRSSQADIGYFPTYPPISWLAIRGFDRSSGEKTTPVGWRGEWRCTWCGMCVVRCGVLLAFGVHHGTKAKYSRVDQGGCGGCAGRPFFAAPTHGRRNYPDDLAPPPRSPASCHARKPHPSIPPYLGKQWA